jgi:hypothetical protein
MYIVTGHRYKSCRSLIAQLLRNPFP